MSKIKSAFFCQSCGYESVKWVGQCPSCGQWNTFIEELIQKESKNNGNGWNDYKGEKRINKTNFLKEKINNENKRLVNEKSEINRVLRRGIVTGNIVLIAGETGIGKSTLFLKTGLLLKKNTTLYISGEESELQV